MDQHLQDNALASYAYELPDEAIAQHPSRRREDSRLLVLDRGSENVREGKFAELPSFLPPNALLVANNSRVLPARLVGRKSTGGAVEFLLLSPLPLLEAEASEEGEDRSVVAEGLLRATGKMRPGDRFSLGDGIEGLLLDREGFGRVRLKLTWQGGLADHFLRQGKMPLPPYIRREPGAGDEERYQTVYADPERLGSVAAPTAGLHFSHGLKEGLIRTGHAWTEVTLYVGYGTFSPIRAEDIREHRMHREYVQVSIEAAEAVALAKAGGRPVVAVGTTTVRVLESVWAARGGIEPFEGWTDLYIRPGFRFNVVDHLITNFHLPKSSLLVMVSAFAGRERILRAYEQAKSRGFLFFSYGDAMLIL
jgi:S-adenosylmethionine:tRNA ribosyltransferase-isomerase